MSVEIATFGGGCFWCMQPPFDRQTGVLETVVGYVGDDQTTASYEQVSSGQTGHVEAVQIRFDSERVSYEQLVDIFWKNIDPTQADGQFADRGPQYRTAIFYHSEEQKRVAELSKETLLSAGVFSGPIATQILPAPTFFEAETAHQGYYKKNKEHYSLYKEGSGRGPYLRSLWENEGDGS